MRGYELAIAWAVSYETYIIDDDKINLLISIGFFPVKSPVAYARFLSHVNYPLDF